MSIHPHSKSIVPYSTSNKQIIGYIVQPIKPLHKIDAGPTLLATLLGRKDDVQFNTELLAIIKRAGPLFLSSSAIYQYVVVPVFMFVDDPTWWRIGCLYALFIVTPVHFLNMGTVSYDVLRLVVTSFEFRYLIFLVGTSYVIFMCLVQDLYRSLGLLGAISGIFCALFTDATYHRRRQLALELVIGTLLQPIIIACLKMRYIARQNDGVIDIWGSQIDLVDVLISTVFKLAWFLACKSSQLMRLLSSNPIVNSVVCEMYHPISYLAPIYSSAVIVPATSSPRSGLVIHVDKKICRIDPAHQVAPPRILKKLKWYLRIHSTLGWIGIVSWASSFAWHLLYAHNTSEVPSLQFFLATVGFVCTSVNWVVSVAHYQCTLVTCLGRQVETWFISIIVAILTIGTCDFVQWDRRTLMMWTPCLWCYWTLFLDTLVPPSRLLLCYQRSMVIVVQVFLLLHPLGVLYWIYFSKTPNTVNHELFHISFGHSRIVQVQVVSAVANQIFDVWIWMGLLLFREITRPVQALRLVNQRVEYKM